MIKMNKSTILGMFKYGGYQYSSMNDSSRDAAGRFVKDEHYSPATEFKKGQHWRAPKPYWDKEWLFNEYITKEKTADQIANENGCISANIHYFLKKFGIKTRSMREIRSKKYWGSSGEQNGMYGRCGEDNPHWLGGLTPERQELYASSEWADIVKAIWKRDKAKCGRCDTYKANDIEMHIHHIITFAVKDMRCELDNLMLVCKKCHNWIHSKKNVHGHFIAQPIKGDYNDPHNTNMADW